MPSCYWRKCHQALWRCPGQIDWCAMTKKGTPLQPTVSPASVLEKRESPAPPGCLIGAGEASDRRHRSMEEESRGRRSRKLCSVHALISPDLAIGGAASLALFDQGFPKVEAKRGIGVELTANKGQLRPNGLGFLAHGTRSSDPVRNKEAFSTAQARGASGYVRG